MAADRFYVRPLWIGAAVVVLALAAAWNYCPLCRPAASHTPPAGPDALAAIRGDPIDPGPPPVEDSPPPAPPPEDRAPAPAPSLYSAVTFDLLASFPYEYPEGPPRDDAEAARRLALFPEKVRALDGTKITLTGYMIPIDFAGDKVVGFLVVRYPFGCCYGRMPQMNEWVYVKMAPGKTAEFVSHIPVPVLGTLTVGEEWERGSLTSLYRMVGDEVDLTLVPR